MTSVCLYFKVHQPYRLTRNTAKGADSLYDYADAVADELLVNFLADNSYLPANEIIHRLIRESKDRFRVSYSISGTALELLQRYRPDVVNSFKKLVKTGCVEILAETYYHSLSFLHSKKEFRRQVQKHAELVEELLGFEPVVFRNTELIHNNELANQVAGLGFRGILCEGVGRVLQDRSPNQLYTAPGHMDFGLLLLNARLSDDIAFRFDDQNWDEFPLTADKFADWLHRHPGGTDVINLLLDYETFGVHKKPASGILSFLEALPSAVLTNENFIFSTPTAVLSDYAVKDVYDVPVTISWEDRSNVSCVWCENMMQNNTLKKIYSIENIVLSSGCEGAIDTWGRLQAADHFYYMSAESCKAAAYKFHNPFISPSEAFKKYSGIVTDFEIGLIEKEIQKREKQTGKTSFINSIL